MTDALDFNDEEDRESRSVALPSSPADRQKLKTMISEATYCLQRADDEKAAVKDIIDVIHSDYGVSKKHTRKLINTLYKQNYSDRVAEEEEFAFLYEALFATNNNKLDEKEVEELKSLFSQDEDDEPPFSTTE